MTRSYYWAKSEGVARRSAGRWSTVLFLYVHEAMYFDKATRKKERKNPQTE